MKHSGFSPGPWTAVANEVIARGNKIDRHIATCHGVPAVADANAGRIARLAEENERLRAALEDAARQLEALSERLVSGQRPGSADYVSKFQASEWAAVLCRDARAALAETKG